MSIIVPPSGSTNARIMLVGDAPGADEERLGEPFMGTSGQELNRMLQESGILRSECFLTNVCRIRPLNNDISALIAKSAKEASAGGFVDLRGKKVKPPIVEGFQMLLKEISLVQPNIIIALGNTPMWALTGRWGIMKHRGSMLYAAPPFPKVKVIPTLHPTYILRDWASRAIAVHDFKRAGRYRNGEDYPIPKWSFTIRPSFEVVVNILGDLLTRSARETFWLDFDLETKLGHIDCAGISWSMTDALCIPFMSNERKDGYWTAEQEAFIVHRLARLLTSPNVWVRGQNLLYDAQYTWRHWGFIPNVRQDTMISQHVMFAGLKKSLDFQASMYCKWYSQWKPDKMVWAEGK